MDSCAKRPCSAAVLVLAKRPFLVGMTFAAAYIFIWCWTSVYSVVSQERPNNSSIPLSMEWLYTAQKSPTNDPPANAAAADDDADCPFRNSSIYRSVYVYPSPGDQEWTGSILTDHGRLLTKDSWPWLKIDEQTRYNETNHYHVTSQHAQFSTELLVRQILTHPDSCLRTHNPEHAKLFWVPYLPSVEFHAGIRGPPPSHQTSVYASAISNAISGRDYSDWKRLFGLTDEYWKRRNGSDHILVFSEPLQGLQHPKGKRGSFHFCQTQAQLDAPIIISVELSTTFVEMHPACAAKNILLPYPVTDGRYFNGGWGRQAAALLANNGANEVVGVSATQELENDNKRPLSVFFRAGLHGVCTPLRVSMTKDGKCSENWKRQKSLTKDYRLGMRLGTFCPCPGGDTASAKRMFDAILAGCIPVVLSHDFVWPLSNEIEPGNAHSLDPADFSIRLPALEYWDRKYNEECTLINASDISLVQYVERIPRQEIARLRQGLQTAADRYSYYPRSTGLVENPLRDNVLPTGGAAVALISALEERASGAKWPACQAEHAERSMADPHTPEPDQFKC